MIHFQSNMQIEKFSVIYFIQIVLPNKNATISLYGRLLLYGFPDLFLNWPWGLLPFLDIYFIMLLQIANHQWWWSRWGVLAYIDKTKEVQDLQLLTVTDYLKVFFFISFDGWGRLRSSVLNKPGTVTRKDGISLNQCSNFWLFLFISCLTISLLVALTRYSDLESWLRLLKMKRAEMYSKEVGSSFNGLTLACGNQLRAKLCWHHYCCLLLIQSHVSRLTLLYLG